MNKGWFWEVSERVKSDDLRSLTFNNCLKAFLLFDPSPKCLPWKRTQYFMRIRPLKTLNSKERNLRRDLDEGQKLRIVNHSVFVKVDLLRILKMAIMISIVIVISHVSMRNQPELFFASDFEGPTLSKQGRPVHHYDDNDNDDDDDDRMVRLSTMQWITSKIAAKRSRGIFPS